MSLPQALNWLATQHCRNDNHVQEPWQRPTAAMLVFRQRATAADDEAALAAAVPAELKAEAERHLAAEEQKQVRCASLKAEMRSSVSQLPVCCLCHSQAASGSGHQGQHLLPVSTEKLNSRCTEYLPFLAWVNAGLEVRRLAAVEFQ